MNPPHPEPLEFRQSAPSSGVRPSLDERIFSRIAAEIAEGTRLVMGRDGELHPIGLISREQRAWLERKEREALGLALRPCDRDQIRRQLEDMGGL